MKKLIVIIPALLLAQYSLLAQSPISASDKEATTKATDATTKVDIPAIDKITLGVSKYKFNETTHDFGKVNQNNPVTCVFEFTNSGTETISLESVQASCGCTTPDWTKDLVEVGKTGKISATYNSANPGSFTKTITVKFSSGETEYLTIIGFVEAAPTVPPTPAAPVNPTITPNN